MRGESNSHLCKQKASTSAVNYIFIKSGNWDHLFFFLSAKEIK